ncbi:BTAD domain-containing putative transcriptional regulator [Saccharothrix sp. Mg75]|uniref:BTAD domain-containing putative transcriptional regulator n=1 Tax=Saccharothrix sp. Mg75 TaxID=3445357 RepID=UPI003EEA2AA5
MSTARCRDELRFDVLGPLEVVRDGRPLPIGSIKQRAVLGYLLAHPNQVVATSRLISALWNGAAPPSARKMVQNAVWRLRALFGERPGSASLHSRPPGYLLEVDLAAVDFFRFGELVAAGRDSAREGAVAKAALLWREALDLWRGPMLSDLVEAGISWPKVKATEAVRLDVLEEYFDAELRLGRHEVVLPDLESVVRAEPRRERLVGQLMLSLYRSGRHADALAAFSSTRAYLSGELGLEPGRDLRELQKAILAHDPALTPTPAPTGVQVVTPPAPPSPFPGAPPVRTPLRAVDDVRELKEVITALFHIAVGPEHADLEELDASIEAVHDLVAERARHFGGTVTGRMGSLWSVTFGVRRGRDNEAMRAMFAVMAVRHGLRLHHPGERVLVRAVVDSGEALVHHRDDGTLRVVGAALDRSYSVLPLVPPGELWVSDVVREQIASRFDCERTPFSGRLWAVTGVRSGHGGGRRELLERDDEVRALLAALDGSPGLVLVTGGSGAGKTALLAEFERRAGQHSPQALLVSMQPFTVDESQVGQLAPFLARCCGIDEADPPGVARARLWAVVERVVDHTGARRVFDALLVALGHVSGHERTAGLDEVVAAWRTLLRGLAAERRVVVLVDDLHAADDTALLAVDAFLDQDNGPLVVAVARPELFDRRPRWRAGAVELPPLSDEAVACEVLDLVAEHGGHPTSGPTVRELARLVVALADGNPMFAVELTRTALAAVDGPTCPSPRDLVPRAVHRVLAARLDGLPDRLRQVLQDAALTGDVVHLDDVRALRPDDAGTAEALEELSESGMLSAVATGRYVFRQPLLRAIARTRVPWRTKAARPAPRTEVLPGGHHETPELLLLLRSTVQRLRAETASRR